jgi:hypothetical protein
MSELNDALKTILAIAILLATLFFTPIIACFIGAFSGWMVSIVFEDTIKLITGIKGEVWQLGATLGFISGFFRINTSNFKKGVTK